MRVAHLCCVGTSQNSYRVLAIRENHDDAETFMRAELQRTPVGFIAPWMYGGDTTEQLDIEFIWDTRLQVKFKPKTGVS